MNRIGVNMGTQDRYLLFVNITIDRIASIVMGDRSMRSVVAFFARYPDYPVMRLRTRPGEAYLAPLENLIHDGSSDGSSDPDIAFVACGVFSL